MSASKIIQAYARKSLTKNQGSGIINLAGSMQSEAKAGEIVTLLQRAGIPINQLDDYIRSETDLLKFLNLIKASNEPRVIPGTSAEGKAITEKLFGKKGEVVDMSGKKLDPGKPIIGGTQDDTASGIMTQIDDRMTGINEANKKLGELLKEREIMYGKAPKTKDNPKVKERKMFLEANERLSETENFVTNTITKIKGMEPITAMKEANLVIGRKGRYKNLTPEESKKILTDTEDHIFERDIPIDPEDMAKGGRAGLYTGGMVDVEPNLSDIGHGSDALMARTRLVSPDGQATTSTGLNYLLAEDNDNIRVPFAGGGMSKRAFLKLLATLTGGAAAFKTGILGLGGGTGKKAVTETVKQSVGSGTPPPYFFKLVEKIKTLGDDTLATKDKAIAKKYKDYVMEEDFAGNIEIIKKGDDAAGNKIEDVYMSLKVDEVPVKGKKGSAKVEEYEEFTARPDAEGKMKDVEPGVPDEVVMEVEAGGGNVPESFYTGPNAIKKADGGRIGFSAGKTVLSKLGITGSSRRFLEKVFGKERFATMIENDPRMEQGMLEVVEMFRKKDKEGLKKYMQKFLPHMDDETVEDFIVGGKGSEGIGGQLIRLGSGREYKSLMDLSKQADNVRKLDKLDVTEEMIRKPNSDGGRIGFSGGGILKAIIAKSAAKKGMSVTDFIKATNYKGLPPEVKMYISAEDFAALKMGQQDLYKNFIDMAKTRLEFQKQIEGGKATPAKPIFEQLEQTMDQQSFVPKTVTADDVAEMELMVKNRFQKGRKDNAQGGLQTMLGE